MVSLLVNYNVGAGDSVHKLFMQGKPASKVSRISPPIKRCTLEVVVKLFYNDNLIS